MREPAQRWGPQNLALLVFALGGLGWDPGADLWGWLEEGLRRKGLRLGIR
jgi:hypothetical protein